MTTYRFGSFFHDQKASTFYTSGIVEPATVIGYHHSELIIGIYKFDNNMMAP
jgi:hypothetical protein